MTQLIYFLFLCCLINMNSADYEPPKTAAYPFGDEHFNADIREDRVQEQSREIAIEVIKDIAVFCPNDTLDDTMQEEIPYIDNECDKCDIRPTVDRTGVLVECFNCSDVSFLISSPEEAVGHILYLTTFLEIANYSAPEEF